MWKFTQVLSLWLLSIPASREQGCLLPLALGWRWGGEGLHVLAASPAVTHVHGSSLGSSPWAARFPSSQLLCTLTSHEPHPPGQSHEGNWDWSEPCHRGGCLCFGTAVFWVCYFFCFAPTMQQEQPRSQQP